MNVITSILTGGFLKGYRTYLIAAGMIVAVVVKYLSGDIGLIDAVTQNWEAIAAALGLLAAAAHKPAA